MSIIQFIKDFKLVFSLAVALISATVMSLNWAYSNIVFASEFNEYKLEQQLNWTSLKGDKLRSEYYGLRNLRNLTPRDKRRLSDIESALDHNDQKQTELEKEIRSRNK